MKMIKTIGGLVGTMKAHDCDKNAWKNRKDYKTLPVRVYPQAHPDFSK